MVGLCPVLGIEEGEVMMSIHFPPHCYNHVYQHRPSPSVISEHNRAKKEGQHYHHPDTILEINLFPGNREQSDDYEDCEDQATEDCFQRDHFEHLSGHPHVAGIELTRTAEGRSRAHAPRHQSRVAVSLGKNRDCPNEQRTTRAYDERVAERVVVIEYPTSRCWNNPEP